MVVTVFGDIEPDEAMAIVKQHFGDLPAGARKPVEFPPHSNAIAESKTVSKTTGKDTAMVMMAYPCEGIYEKEDHAAMTVLRAILNGYSTPGGWLHNELRGEGLIYYVFTREMTGPVPGFFVVASQTYPEKLDEVVQRIHRNLDKAKKGDISDAEFHTAIEQIVALHAQENVTITEQARTAAIDEILGLGYDYDKKFDDQIRAVTKDDVIRAANKYLTKSVLVTTSPKK
jgi:zinc protease